MLVSKDAIKSARGEFKLVKKYHSELKAQDLLPWTGLPLTDQFLGKSQEKISVQCRGPDITILLQDTPVAKFADNEFREGLVGMILFGEGRAIFRDLVVEEVHAPGLTPPLSHVPGSP